MILFPFQGTPGASQEPSEKPRDESIASRLTPDGHVGMNYMEEKSASNHGGSFHSSSVSIELIVS